MFGKNLVKERESKANLSKDSSNMGASSSSESLLAISPLEKKLSNRYDDFVKASMVGNCKTELESYLGNIVFICKDNSFDILKWWKVNAVQYLLLSKIARDILAISVSTVASESALAWVVELLVHIVIDYCHKHWRH